MLARPEGLHRRRSDLSIVVIEPRKRLIVAESGIREHRQRSAHRPERLVTFSPVNELVFGEDENAVNSDSYNPTIRHHRADVS